MFDPTPLLTPSPTPAEWYKPITDLWPVFAGLVVIATGGLAGLAYWRYSEKAAIHKTNAENIEALNRLLATRDKELEDARDEIAALEAEKTELEENHKAEIAARDAEYETLQTEYKTTAGIVLSDIMAFAVNYDKFMSDRAAAADAFDVERMQMSARIRVLEKTLEAVQTGKTGQ
jgi:predicted nuclease with TOPRIM domain